MKYLLSFAAALTSAAQSPSFDVASLKPVELTGDLYRANLGTARNGEVVLENVTLGDCLKFAYGLSNDVQLEGPPWMHDKSIRFNIQARSAPETPRDQLLFMLQTLLTERFQLSLHHEPKTRSYLALTVGKKGLKIEPTPEGEPPSGSNNGPGHIITRRINMPILALLLSRFLREPVVDQTELSGPFAVKLEWQRDDDPASGPSIYTAVQEQLGLRLESRKGRLDVLVIDHAEKTPLAN